MTNVLDDASLKVVVAKAVYDAMTPENREALLSNAIKALLSDKVNDRSYNSPTLLQDAFNGAVRNVAADVAREMLKDDAALKEKIRALFSAAWEKLVGGEKYEQVVEKVANAMEKAVTGDRY